MSLAMIIVIGWLYVTLLVAANEATLLAGVVSFVFYGALPCALVLYFSGHRLRRQRQRFREQQANRDGAPAAGDQ